jgi:glycosyltransferase involved in cell wall biosynthesis
MDSPSSGVDQTCLRVVVIKDGEPLPQFCAPWTFRVGNLCTELARRGHDVTWISSTFRHNEKEFYCLEETVEEREEGYEMRFLQAGGYRGNISFGRWRHHLRFALGVAKVLRELPRPDVVICCIPILEVATICQFYCNRQKIPMILDIQDPWPKVFVDYAPQALKPLVRTALAPYFWNAARLFRSAHSLVSVSHGFLSWAQNLARRGARSRARDKVVYIGGHGGTAEIAPDPLLATKGLRSIYMGAFAGPYDFEPLARMLEIQAARGDDHHMFILGKSGKRYERLRERLQSLPNVTFTGWLPREQVYAVAKTCHLGWLPLGLGNEGYAPNKLFEYPALGLPIATRRQGEAGEMVAKHGIGFCYDDCPESLASELSSLIPGGDKLEGWRARCEIFSKRIGDARVCAGQFADHIERAVASARRPEGPARLSMRNL